MVFENQNSKKNRAPGDRACRRGWSPRIAEVSPLPAHRASRPLPDSKIFRVLIGGGLPKHFSHFPEIWANFKKKSPILRNLTKLASLLSKPLKFCEIQKKIGENLMKICKICRLYRKSTKSVPNFAKMVQKS